MPNMNQAYEGGPFLFEETINASGTVTALLNTENHFLDKNIGIRIITPAGVATTGSATATMNVSTTASSNAGTNVYSIVSTAQDPTVEPNSGYYIAITANPSGASHIDRAGWFNEGNLSTVNGTSVTNYFTLQGAEGTVTKKSGSINPQASLEKSSTLVWSDTNTSGISVTAHGNGTATFVAQANITTAGYIPAGNDKFRSGSLSIAAASTDATAIKYLTEATIGSGKSFKATINQGTLNVFSDNKSTGTVNVTAYKSSTDTSTRVARQIIKNGVWNAQTITAANTEYYGLVTVGATTITTSSTNTNIDFYFNEATSNDNDVIIIPKYTATAGYTTAITTATNNTGTTYWKIKTASPTFKAVPTGDSDAQFTNITTSSTNNGIKVQTRYSINSVNIQYAAAMSGGWLSDKAANANTGSTTTSKAKTNSTTGVYYITAITVPTATNFSITTTANSSADSSVLTIVNNNNRKATFTNNAGDVIVRHTTSNKGNVYVRPYGKSSDIQVVSNGSMYMTTITTPTWTKDSTSYVTTMDNYSWTSGYIEAGNLGIATFHNTATSGKTYVDLSDALVSSGNAYVVPEISEDGYLYIDRGYIDYVKISLGHLIPGTEGTNAIADTHILSGYSAYDKDGNLITGAIVEKTASNLTFDPSTGTFITPAGYYASNATYTIGLAKVTTSHNFPGSGDNDLDSYLTPLNNSSGADVSINRTYTTTAGYIGIQTNINSGTTYYKLKSPTFENAGGISALAVDTTNTSTARSIYTAEGNTFISIGSSAPDLSSTGKVYIKITSEDQIKTTSSGRGAIKSGVTVATKGSHTSYIGIDLYTGSYSYVSSL